MSGTGTLIPRTKRKLVIVDWEDAAGQAETGWKFVEEVGHEPFMCRSVGWIVRDGKNHITVAPHFGHVTQPEDQEQMHGFLHIPRAMIRKMKVLRA